MQLQLFFLFQYRLLNLGLITSAHWVLVQKAAVKNITLCRDWRYVTRVGVAKKGTCYLYRHSTTTLTLRVGARVF